MLDHSQDTAAALHRSDQDRAALAAAIDTLKQRIVDQTAVPVDALTQAARKTASVCRANPVATGVILAGLATLAYTALRTTNTKAAPSPIAGTTREAVARWADDGGPVLSEAESADVWMAEAEGLRAQLAAARRTLDAAAKAAVAPMADIARHRADLAANYAADLARVFRHGLSDLTEAAQERIAAARESAFTAGESVSARSTAFVTKSPFLALLAALGLGAAAAAVLPSTGVERRTLAAPRARLLAEARRLLAEERA
ncbi:MAG: hypothetical protein Q7J57_18070 [Gemmobacter sp.]|nr:hypothetical protein [Gemmobacter sp.]